MIALVLAALCAFASAQIPTACGTVPAKCTPYVPYTTYYYLPVSVVDSVFDFLDSPSNPLCTNCKNNLKQLVCRMQYPQCLQCAGGTFNLCSTLSKLPCRASCEQAIGSCIPNDSDLPAEIKAQISAAFDSTLKQVLGGQNCTSLPATDCFNVTLDMAQTSCPCSVPTNLNFCSDVVNYPVSNLVLTYAGSTFDGIAATTYNATSQPLAAVSCPECDRQIKKTSCTASFYRCNAANNDFFVPPCTSVCDDLLSSCRVRQYLDPSFVNLTASIPGLVFPTNDIQNAIAACSGAPFSNGTCNNGTYIKEAPCPCQSVNLTGPCKDAVGYQVAAPLAPYASMIETAVNASLGQYGAFSSLVCPECYNGIVSSACRTAFPQCTLNQLALPVCKSGCEALVAPCNVSAIPKLLCKEFPEQNCYTPDVTTSNVCNYCIRRTDLVNCARVVDYDTFNATIPGLDIKQADLLIGFLLLQNPVDIPNCPQCTNALKKTLCSTFIFPCTRELVESAIEGLLNQTGPTEQTDLTKYFSRPCYSGCQDIFRRCVPPNVTLTLNCNYQPPPQVPVQTLFVNDSNCFSFDWSAYPPANCTASGSSSNGATGTQAGTQPNPSTEQNVSESAMDLPLLLLVYLVAFILF